MINPFRRNHPKGFTMRLHFAVLLIGLLSVPALAESAPPEVTQLNLERPAALVPGARALHEPSFPVVTLAAGELIPEAPAPASSVLGGFFGQFLTPQGIASIVVTILGLVGGAMGLTALRKRQIAIVTQHAFHGVEDFSATTETTVDDKIAAGLKIADSWMAAQGWRPLKPGEAEVVKLGFTALNGAMKAAEKVQTAALEAALPVEPPSVPPAA